VPFIPLGDTSMEACVDLARELGKRVGEKLQIPVFLYEQAALIPERKNLEAVRRGEYERLKQEIGSNPERAPDFGPAKLGKAGAVIIGARQPLIAYNVYLDTENVDIAQRIARAVRFSSGGLRFVKALGLEVDGRAQVSMNLTDFSRTPIARVQEMIRVEAARYGVSIHHSELVGLIPEKAVIDAAKWYLQLHEFDASQILERKLGNVLGGGDSFLEELADAKPTPGGGSAAAYSGAMAAALTGMVARLTIGKKGYAEIENRMLELAAESDRVRSEMETAVEADAQAFNQVLSAYRLPKTTEEESGARAAAIEQATQHAAEVPLKVASGSLDVLKLAVELVRTGNKNAISDAAAAGAFARASIRAAELNVRINTQSLSQAEQAQRLDSQIAAIKHDAEVLGQDLDQSLLERADL
jgi:glutamate formiminotransferase/formiminotetrahydrofolate cyclodeaminase